MIPPSPDAPLVGATLLPNRQHGLVWALDVACPYCARTHHHGGGSSPVPDLGHRVAHCAAGTGQGGYNIRKAS